MLLDVVADAEPQQILLLQPSVGEILRILQAGSGIREGIVIDRDTDGAETVYLLNQVDEADLLQLMDEEEAAQYIESIDPTETAPEVTEPEPVVVAPKPDPNSDYVDFGYVEEESDDWTSPITARIPNPSD